MTKRKPGKSWKQELKTCDDCGERGSYDETGIRITKVAEGIVAVLCAGCRRAREEANRGQDQTT